MTDATALRTSAQGTPADVAIKPRDIPFYRDGVAGSAGLDRWAGSLAETHYMNAMSMTFPEGERFFIDSVKHFRSLATGKLAEDVRNFITRNRCTRASMSPSISISIRRIIRSRKSSSSSRGGRDSPASCRASCS